MTDQDIETQNIKCLAQAIMAGCHSAEDLRVLAGLLGLATKDEAETALALDEVWQRHPKQAQQLRAGNDKLTGFFVGQVAKMSKTYDPALVGRLVQQKAAA